MTKMLVYDCLVTLCCDKIERLLMACPVAYVAHGQSPSRLMVRIIDDNMEYSFLTPMLYCPYCGEKIVVKQAGGNNKMTEIPGIFDNWENLPQYNKDHPKAKFKIGEEVKYHGQFEVLPGTIVGLNYMEGTTFEYALRGFHFLVWEDEIEKEE